MVWGSSEREIYAFPDMADDAGGVSAPFHDRSMVSGVIIPAVFSLFCRSMAEAPLEEHFICCQLIGDLY